MSVWFVTGASRGFGAEIVEKALAAGHSVVATARDPRTISARFPDAGDQLLPVALDVLDEAQAAAAVEAAVQRFGRIDVVVNNAGRGLLSAVEEASDAAARAVFDTNVFGILNVQRAVLPTLRAQRSGRIVNLSSIGGFIGSAGWGIYCATKFAVEGFSEALAREVRNASEANLREGWQLQDVLIISPTSWDVHKRVAQALDEHDTGRTLVVIEGCDAFDRMMTELANGTIWADSAAS